MNDFRYLPNLSALRAFEAAARHESFSRAAEEIHLTHGAISHQVRQLEQELGVSLFVRQGKRLTLSENGRRYAQAVRLALSDLVHATQNLQREGNIKRLSITCLPSFGARWLAPRLAHFVDQYPDLEVNLNTSQALVDFNREAFDVGIRYGRGNYPGLHREFLMADAYYPVARPDYVERLQIREIEDLKRANLLRNSDEPWSLWFRAAGLDWSEPSVGLVFEDSSVQTRAAVDGQGVALGRHSIVEIDIQRGALVRLFDISVLSPHAYYLVCLPQALEKAQVRLFSEWLRAEVDNVSQQRLIAESLAYIPVEGFGGMAKLS